MRLAPRAQRPQSRIGPRTLAGTQPAHAPPPALAVAGAAPTFDVSLVFQQQNFYLLNSNAVIGDVTGDGRNDLVVLVKPSYGASNTVQDRVMLFRQDAGGRLQAPIEHVNSNTYNFGYRDIALGDLDRDGDLDIVLSRPGGLNTLKYRADGTFAFSVTNDAGQPYGLRLLDVDRDGRLDAVFRGVQYSGSVYHGDGTGGFSRLAPLWSVPPGNLFSVGDVTSDGLPDIVASDGGQYRTAVIPHDQIVAGAPMYYPHEPSPRGYSDAAIGDFNRDGRNDIAIAIGMEEGPILHLRHQDATRTLGPATRITLPVTDLNHDMPVGIAADDINGDGLHDLLMVYGANPMRLGILRQGEVGFEPLQTVPGLGSSGSGTRPLAVGDLDGDGCRDVVALASQEIVLFRNTGCVRSMTAEVCRTQAPVVVATGGAAPAMSPTATVAGSATGRRVVVPRGARVPRSAF